MIRDYYVTKRGMAQAWTTAGKRVAVTKLIAPKLAIIRHFSIDNSTDSKQSKRIMLEIGFGKKKLKNMAKSLRTQLKRSDFSFGVKKIVGVEWLADEPSPKDGQTLALQDVLAVGDVVDVQGTVKGRGFAGVMKRHGFGGGPATHGQSDRSRAPGSIGAGTYPGRVWKGKRMAGHMGNVAKTVRGLVVLHIDPKTGEIWLNGPVPGSFNSIVRIRKTDKTRDIQLDRVASGLPVEELVEESADQPVEKSAQQPAQEKKIEDKEKDKETIKEDDQS